MATGERRISIWVGQRDMWMLDVVEAIIKRREKEGKKTSQGEVLREVLREGFQKELELP